MTQNRSNKFNLGFNSLIVPTLFICSILIFIELLGRAGVVPTFLIPLPSQVGLSVVENFESFFEALKLTFLNATIGLIITILASIILALLCTQFEILLKTIYPICVILQVVPLVAIAPLLVIWFGFGSPTVIASSCIVSFFPLLASFLNGLQISRTDLEELLTSFGASKWQKLIVVRLPVAIPHFMSGLEIASGLSVIGAIVGEFIAGGGLGSLIDSARTQQKVEMVFGAILISSILGLFQVGLIKFMRHFLFKKWFYQ